MKVEPLDKLADPDEPCALWQWEHRTGFKDYDGPTCGRIELAYRNGEPYVRLKTGKMKQTPMELFFVDMIQYDPITKNTRRIRRTRRDTWWEWIGRKFGEVACSLETGKRYRMNFNQFHQSTGASIEEVQEQPREIQAGSTCQKKCARISQHGAFLMCTLVVIILNSLWLGVDANFNNAPTIWQADPGFQVVEHFFSIAFIAELIVRFLAFEPLRECLLDSWFCFDTFLVAIMVGENLVMLPVFLIKGDDTNAAAFGELTILRFMKLLRLTRLTRVARLFRFAPEILTMLRGISLALRSVAMTAVMLFILVYLFGIIFKLHSKSFPEIESFPTLVESMFTLLLQGTFLDAVSEIMHEISVSWILTFLFMLFVFLSNFTLLNMLVGILCEVVCGVSQREKDRAAWAYLRGNLLEILEVHDKNDDRHIRKDDFELLMQNPEVQLILMNFGVDTGDLISLQGILFEGKRVVQEIVPSGGTSNTDDSYTADRTVSRVYPAESRELPFEEFLEVVLRLRGGNGASVRDIVDLREYLRQRLDHFELQQPTIQRSQSSALTWDQNTESPGCTSPFSAWQEPQPDVVGTLLQQISEVREELRAMRDQIGRLEGEGLQQTLSYARLGSGPPSADF
mmetsp:Transcript_97530/g.271345  ORF Transcript_97530/g.271345 Transcript_97530/m.271345 type:complete len:626 (-) Transcript_97530:33-1910(-)